MHLYATLRSEITQERDGKHEKGSEDPAKPSTALPYPAPPCFVHLLACSLPDPPLALPNTDAVDQAFRVVFGKPRAATKSTPRVKHKTKKRERIVEKRHEKKLPT